MRQNPHWQCLIDAQKTGARVDIQQKNGDSLVNVKIISTEDDIVLEDEDGGTVTIELNKVGGVKSREVISDESEPGVQVTDWETLVKYHDRINTIVLRTGAHFFVKSVNVIDPKSLSVLFYDTNNRPHDFQIKNIAEIHVAITM